MAKILGFDISSSCIGWCVLELDDKTKQISYVISDIYKPPKKGDIIERLAKTKKAIIALLKKHSPDIVAIEELVKFMPKSTATTVIALTGFNRLVGLTVYEHQKQLPPCYNVMAIRHGIKFSSDLPSKQEIPDVVAKHLRMAPIIHYDKKGKIAMTTYDQADATAVAIYAAKIVAGDITPKPKKKKKRKPKKVKP